MSLSLMSPAVEIGIVTNNPEPMRHFYHSVLGFEPMGELSYPGGCQYRYQQGNNIIKLVVLTQAPPHAGQMATMAEATGIRYISFGVKGLRDTVQKLLQLGVSVPVAVTEFSPEIGFAFISDPDGNWIELFGPL